MGPGAFAVGEVARVPPGAVAGRSPPVTWFHGHMVSFRLCPTLIAPGSPARPRNGYAAGFAVSKRLKNHCHLAQRRSTLACSKKNRGSFAAVAILEIKPLKLVCADPWGLSSMTSRKLVYRFPAPPRRSVAASFLPPACEVFVLKRGILTIPG